MPASQEKYAYTFLCNRFRPEDGRRQLRRAIGFVMASSKEEAKGKALRIARKSFPSSEGWGEHDVLALAASTLPVDPDLPIKTTEV